MAAPPTPAAGLPGPDTFPRLLDHLLERRALPQRDAEALMQRILAGGLGAERLAALVTAIRAKPLDAFELAGFAAALRGAGHRVATRKSLLLDTCGTGAARVKTFNVSTASAFVVAAAGVPVAKHGNRSVTRPSGSADVLARCGVRLELTPAQAAGILDRLGIVFLHAPAFHPAMKHAAQVRQALGVRTVFNLLGPLANPAGATHQVVGVYDPEALRPMADALHLLGVRHAYVLHGEPGHDEASLSGPTHAIHLDGGHVRPTAVHTPESLGFTRRPPQAVAPVPADEAAALLHTILQGKATDARVDMVALNAGFALHLAGRAPTLAQAMDLARATLRSGAAADLLDRYAQATQAAA